MMTASEVQRWLSDHYVNRSHLFPGIGFIVHDDPYEGVVVRIQVIVPSTYPPYDPLPLDIKTFLSPNDRADRQSLQRWLVWRLCRIATHEAREGFEVDGVKPYDPHDLVNVNAR